MADRQSPFIFVTDGIDSALAQARAVAGDEGVGISGGASAIESPYATHLLYTVRRWDHQTLFKLAV
jgi:hypothetical protein